jgi:2-furoyl-CoA dehydrogenase large subunit
VHGKEKERPSSAGTQAAKGARALHGEGETKVSASPEQVWAMLLDVDTLATIIPGAHAVEKVSDKKFRADVTIGVGPVKGRYRAEIKLSDLDPPRAVSLSGSATGALGFGSGKGRITLSPEGSGTRISYGYDAEIGGKIAAIGGRLLDGAARMIIRQFFAALACRAGGAAQSRFFARIRLLFRRRP